MNLTHTAPVAAGAAPTLLLSDLHLPTGASVLRERFQRFLAGPARSAAVVYILGDLFESWVGDDIGLRAYAAEARGLRRLTEHGVVVLLQHGNRDFLIGRRFTQATGVRLLPDPALVDLGGVPSLLSHGDLYCTDDHGYQRWRRFAHDSHIQSLFLRMPSGLRRRIGQGLRGGSRAATRDKPAAIMDVNAEAIREAFRHGDAVRLIHGHTHRPADHRVEVDGRSYERIVLADWRPGLYEYLSCSADGQLQRVQM